MKVIAIQGPIFRSFTRKNGKNDVENYLNSLPIKAMRKVLFVLSAISKITLPKAVWSTNYVRRIVSNARKPLFEVRARISNRQERIIYFHLHDNVYYLLNGFTKSKPQIQSKAIRKAEQLELEVIRRYHDGTL